MRAQGAPPEVRPAGAGHGRALAVWALLVVAGILLLLSSFAVWVNRVALDTDVFVDTSSELLADDAIREAVAVRAVDELFDSVDVQAEIEGQLPRDFKSLSGPATAGLRQASYELVDRALERPALQRLWARSLRESHRTLLRVLEDDVPAFSTTGGIVTLDLRLIVLEAAERIGIRNRIEDELPTDVGTIEILRSDELDAAQDSFRILRTLGWALPVLMLLAFAAAVALSRDRRRAARAIGVVLLATGAAGLVATSLLGNYLVTELTSETDAETAAANAWGILTELLRATFRSLVAVGVLFLFAAWLAGPGRRSVATRRVLAPVIRDRAWPYAALAVVAAFLLLGARVNDFARTLLVLVLLALGVAWIELLRRQTRREFPDAVGYASFAEARERLTAWLARQRETRLDARARSAGATLPADDLTTRLARLADLHARGELTDAEYGAAKARVLAGD